MTQEELIEEERRRQAQAAQSDSDLFSQVNDVVNHTRKALEHDREYVTHNQHFYDGLYHTYNESALVDGSNELTTQPNNTDIVDGSNQITDYSSSNIVDGSKGLGAGDISSIVDGSVHASFSEFDTGLVNGAYEIPYVNTNKDDTLSVTRIVEIESATPDMELGDPADNLAAAYSYSEAVGYASSQTAQSSVSDSDVYAGAQTVHDIIRVMTNPINSMSEYAALGEFAQFAASDLSHDLSWIMDNEFVGHTERYITGDDGTVALFHQDFSSYKEAKNALFTAQNQINAKLNSLGMDLSGVKRSEISASLESGVYTFGALKGKTLSSDATKLLAGYNELDKLSKYVNGQGISRDTGKETRNSRLITSIKGTDTHQGRKQINSFRRTAVNTAFFVPSTVPHMIHGTADFMNKRGNVKTGRVLKSYDRKIKRAEKKGNETLRNQLIDKKNDALKKRIDKNKAYNERKKNRGLVTVNGKTINVEAKINSTKQFLSATPARKFIMTAQFTGKKIMGTRFGQGLSNSRLGRFASRLNNRFNKSIFSKNGRMRFVQNNKFLSGIAKKLNPLKSGFAFIRKLLMRYIIIFICVISLLTVLGSVLISLSTTLFPFSGEENLNGTDLSATMRQEGMDDAMWRLQSIQQYLLTGEDNGNAHYNGQLKAVNVYYPYYFNRMGSSTRTWTADGINGNNVRDIMRGGDTSSIVNLEIPWKYIGIDSTGYVDDGNSSGAAAGHIDYLGKSDANTTPRIESISTVPEYDFTNFSGTQVYFCDGVTLYTVDELFKAIMSMTVASCGALGNNDTALFNAYFTTIFNMVIANSYYEIDVHFVPDDVYSYTGEKYIEIFEDITVLDFDEAGNEIGSHTETYSRGYQWVDTTYTDTAYICNCNVVLHLDASVEDLMELADHWDPTTDKFTTYTDSISKWQTFLCEFGAGAEGALYDNGEIYQGFFKEHSNSFNINSLNCRYDNSGYNYILENTTFMGAHASSLFNEITLKDWTNEFGFKFIGSDTIAGNNATQMARLLSDSEIEDYLTQVQANYDGDLSSERIAFLRQALTDIGHFYYSFGSKASESGAPMGLDCSGFVGHELYKAGLISSPVQSTGSLEGHAEGKRVSYSDLKPGDIIVKYDSVNDTDLHWSSHVVIYLGKVDGKELTVECTTYNGTTGSQLGDMSRRTQFAGYDCVMNFFGD